MLQFNSLHKSKVFKLKKSPYFFFKDEIPSDFIKKISAFKGNRLNPYCRFSSPNPPTKILPGRLPP